MLDRTRPVVPVADRIRSDGPLDPPRASLAARQATATRTRPPVAAARQDEVPAALMRPAEWRRPPAPIAWGGTPATRTERHLQPTPAARAAGGTAQVAALEDARLLTMLAKAMSFVRTDILFPRLVFTVLGFAAISSLALAYIEAVPLPVSATFILAPAAAAMILLGLHRPEWGRRALIGWMAGIVATMLYDVARLAAVQLGVFGDPIPSIGDLLLNREGVHWIVGYTWRFLGNGGGMAIAFTMLPWRGVRAGAIYGTMICLGLFAVLAFFPVSQTHFFPLEPLTAAVGMLGHWIYGAVLGGITKHYLPPSGVRVRPEPRWREAGNWRASAAPV